MGKTFVFPIYKGLLFLGQTLVWALYLQGWLTDSLTVRFLKFPAYEGSRNINSWPINMKFDIQLYFMTLSKILEVHIA